MDLFSDMEASGFLCTTNAMHIECMRFCFMDLLQYELDTIRMEWNHHSVRRYRQATPYGKPDMLFYIPSLYGAIDYKIAVDQGDLDAVPAEYQVPIPRGCMDINAAQFHTFMSERGLRMPSSADEAVELFGQLVGNIDGAIL
ncbi:uncharacterized protein LOC117325763 [Pecten maximus]|uniref:uncharacterized protein LOC117325763 n=1 Tax=Pecten maximus TaxID=6579 RepID=UPI001458C3D4|nr:uncharacterized protein LOC117325763 [Pecten maximus]